MDLSGDTLSASDQLLSGVTAHASDGTALTGSLEAMRADVYDPAGGGKQVAFADEVLALTGGTVGGDVTINGNLNVLSGVSNLLEVQTGYAEVSGNANISGSLGVTNGIESTGNITSGGAVTGVNGYFTNLTIGNHATAVGSLSSTGPASKSVSTGTCTSLRSLSLTAGTWILTGGVGFENNFVSGSHLAVNLSTTSGDAGFTTQNSIRDNHASATVYEQIVRAVTLTGSATYYLNCYHTCGASKTVSGYLNAVRIA